VCAHKVLKVFLNRFLIDLLCRSSLRCTVFPGFEIGGNVLPSSKQHATRVLGTNKYLFNLFKQWKVQKQNWTMDVPFIWPVDEGYGEKSNDVLRLLCDHFRCNLVSIVHFC